MLQRVRYSTGEILPAGWEQGYGTPSANDILPVASPIYLGVIYYADDLVTPVFLPAGQYVVFDAKLPDDLDADTSIVSATFGPTPDANSAYNAASTTDTQIARDTVAGETSPVILSGQYTIYAADGVTVVNRSERFPLYLDNVVRSPGDTPAWNVAAQLPGGGTAGQVLAKATNLDYDGVWVDVPLPPLGTTAGTVAAGDDARIVGAQNVANVHRLVNLGAIDRSVSAARQRLEYEDAAQWTESWANLTAWASVNVQVSGGRLYHTGTTGNPTGCTRAANLDGAGRGRWIYHFNNTLGTTDPGNGIIMAGVGVGAVGNPPAAGASDIIAIGIGSGGRVIVYDRGSPSFLSAGAVDATFYTIVATCDGSNLSLVMRADDGSEEYRYTVSQPAITQASLWNSDSRNLSGYSFGSSGGKAAMATIAPRAGVEGVAATALYLPINGHPARIALPANYDSRRASPLCIFFHPYTGDELTPFAEANPKGVCDALNAAGYIVASTVGPAQNDWGNQNALDQYATLYQYVRDHYATGPVVFLSESMGGLSGLLMLADHRIPGVCGWAGIVPVCSLAAAYANPNFTVSIATAYGIDGSHAYATQTAGHDPLLLPGSFCRGVPMQAWVAFSGDTSAAHTQHADPLIANVMPFADSAVVEITPGTSHTDPANFIPSEVVGFFNRCIAGH